MICRSLSDSNEWYLAGVVSYGHGCARAGETGVYTRLTSYLDWVEKVQNDDGFGVEPQQECLGFKCIWGGGKCLTKRQRCNGKVECLVINCLLTNYLILNAFLNAPCREGKMKSTAILTKKYFKLLCNEQTMNLKMMINPSELILVVTRQLLSH